jgi:ABC-type transport system substrate-binding protein
MKTAARDRRGALAARRRPTGSFAAPGMLTLLITLCATAMSPPRSVEAGPHYGGTIHVAFALPGALTFDPAQALFADWRLVRGALYNGLYRLDRNGQPQLDLAAAPPTISADRTVWTFRLRPGVRFSNGMEVTADGVKFSLTRTLDPNLKPVPSWDQTATTSSSAPTTCYVPALFLKSTELVSPRVGGFYYNPFFGWQYEDYWLQP